MTNLRRYFLIFCLLLFLQPLKADVIYFSITQKRAAVSLEGIVSYELAFLKSNTINFWCGGEVVCPVVEFAHPAYGPELELEIRQYFTKNTFQNFNLGLYTGLTYMVAPDFYCGKVVRWVKSSGFVPGLKLIYKLNMAEEFVAESYLSLSLPFCDERFDSLLDDSSDSGLVTTLEVCIS